jgi:hypothetical protein
MSSSATARLSRHVRKWAAAGRAAAALAAGLLVNGTTTSQAAGSLPCDIHQSGGTPCVAPQDSFCSGTTCLITAIYHQSGRGNDLTRAPPAMRQPARTTSPPGPARPQPGHAPSSFPDQPGPTHPPTKAQEREP